MEVKKLILWESSYWNISPEVFVVCLIGLDEGFLATNTNWLAINRIFPGRRFAGYLSFIKVEQGDVFRKANAP